MGSGILVGKKYVQACETLHLIALAYISSRSDNSVRGKNGPAFKSELKMLLKSMKFESEPLKSIRKASSIGLFLENALPFDRCQGKCMNCNTLRWRATHTQNIHRRRKHVSLFSAVVVGQVVR